MDAFPRTNVGGLSVSRLIIGTNWFLGWSHCTKAKDNYIKENIRDRKKIAEILEVFFRNGVDTIMGLIEHLPLQQGIKEAEDRTGVKAIVISTPGFPIKAETPAKGINKAEAERILDVQAKGGAKICMPHVSATDLLVDHCTREIRCMAPICAMIRERGMIPGLSTHTPETIIYADETHLDVETYIQIYNSMGFLMHVEVDWISRVIHEAKKPVMTIKPMAAGQLRPFQALNFVWNTLRPQDMVTVGTMSPQEAAEVIEMSRNIIEHHDIHIQLQETRSKASLKKQANPASSFV